MWFWLDNYWVFNVVVVSYWVLSVVLVSQLLGT